MEHAPRPGSAYAGRNLGETDPPGSPGKQRHLARNAWRRLCRLVRANTLAPSWLPVRLRHPAFGYLAAVILEVIAVALTLLLKVLLPGFSLFGVLVALTALLIALNWGGSPSLFAMLVGVGLLYYTIPSPPFSWGIKSRADLVGLGLVLVLGFLISLVAGQAARARRQAELAHLEAEARAQALAEANQRMDTFLGIASHELKTPISSILLGLQILQRRVQRAAPPVTRTPDTTGVAWQHTLEVTLQQVGRLNRLVNDLLDLSRIQGGQLEFTFHDADLVALVRQAVEEQRQLAPERTIHLPLPGEQPVPVWVDAERIRQAVTNYLTNALKYSSEECPVEVGVQVEAEQVRVWVRDQGPGIPPEEQARIWERFHRVPGVEILSGSGIGLGLGLHICQTILERHGGQVGVKSIPGEGSTFWFTLPLRPGRHDH